jgi:hypothetical protein
MMKLKEVKAVSGRKSISHDFSSLDSNFKIKINI